MITVLECQSHCRDAEGLPPDPVRQGQECRVFVLAQGSGS